jgi:hypothetical protein
MMTGVSSPINVRVDPSLTQELAPVEVRMPSAPPLSGDDEGRCLSRHLLRPGSCWQL